jgi:hypothetical protein
MSRVEKKLSLVFLSWVRHKGRLEIIGTRVVLVGREQGGGRGRGGGVHAGG